MSLDTIGIIGAGNSAHALAAYFASRGHAVTLYARDVGKIARLAERRSIEAVGKIEGTFPLAGVTQDLAQLAATSQTIFLATVTTAYPEVIRRLAPHLGKDHVVVPFSSKLCGSHEVAQGLAEAGAGHVPVIETDALFACRIREDGVIWIRGFKGWNLYSCPRRSETREFGGLLARYFPGLEPATSLLHRGLTDFGALAHAVITLANISRIDRQDDFLFYYEGLSPRTVVLLEAMEREFRQVAAAYDVELIPAHDLLDRYYGCSRESLHAAMTSVPNYRHSQAPKTLDHRYLQEDVACTLVPLQGFARKAGVETPMVDAVISLASILNGYDARASGRTLANLGLDRLTHKEIVAWMQS